MFSKFFEFVGINNSEHFASVESFLKAYAGKSFLNGLYRLFRLSDISKWNEIVKKSFPQCVERINVFGFDWLGRIFAMDLDNNTVLLFEPGTGEVLDIPANFIDFHNVEIAKYHQESLASNFFYEWYEEYLTVIAKDKYGIDCDGQELERIYQKYKEGNN